jgi:3-dehydroquinate synthase
LPVHASIVTQRRLRALAALLAQVDSAVGGKTGINTRHGKNLVGTFHQPRLVLADIYALSTLARREFLAGYAEVVKYGLIGDAAFFAWLDDHASAIRDGDRAARRHAVATSCAAKAAIVSRDEREASGLRALSISAIPSAMRWRPSAAMGTRSCMARPWPGDVPGLRPLGQLGLCPTEDADRVRRHLAMIGLRPGFRSGSGTQTG